MRLITDNSAWHPENKDWLKSRKDEWKKIEVVLKALKPFLVKGSYVKHHKELFFKGTISGEEQIKYAGGHEFGFAYSLFWMWYHPEPSLEKFDEIVRQTHNYPSLDEARFRLLEYGAGILDGMDREYGVFGGREKWMTPVLVRSVDRDDVWKAEGRGKFELSIPPNIMAIRCVALSGLLMANQRVNPYMPGRYLWPMLDKVFHEVTEERRFGDVREIVRLTLTFDEREGPHHEDRHARELRDELLGPYKDRSYSPAMLALWDDVAGTL